jgi:hypothetical protein
MVLFPSIPPPPTTPTTTRPPSTTLINSMDGKIVKKPIRTPRQREFPHAKMPTKTKKRKRKRKGKEEEKEMK